MSEKKKYSPRYGDRSQKSNIDGVDLMIIGNPLAVQTGKEQLHNYFRRMYGEAGSFLMTGVYHPPTVNDKLEMLESFSLPEKGALSKMKQSIIIKYVEEMASFKKTKEIMFGIILSVLDPVGKDKVESDASFEDLEKNHSDDPFALWNLVTKVYASGGRIGGNAVLARQNARAEYSNLYMKENQSLLEYKKMFEAVLELMKSLHVPLPDSETIALDFFLKVDKKRYGFLLDTLSIEATRGVDNYPKTMDEAVHVLSNYQMPYEFRRREHIQGKQTAFVAASDQGKQTAFVATSDKKKRKESRAEKMKKFPCNKCGMLGHWADTCKKSESSESSGVANRVTSNALVAASKSKSYRTLCVLDTGASDHILNNDFAVTQVEHITDPVIVSSADSDFEISLSGTCGKLGNVLVHKSMPVSLISWRELEKKYTIDYKRGEAFIVHVGDHELTFKLNKKAKLYTCTYDELVNAVKIENEHKSVNLAVSNYTKSETARAEQAIVLMKKLGRCSPNDLMKLLNSGCLIESTVTSADVVRAVKLFGPDIHRLMGNMVQQGPVGVHRGEYVPTVRVHQTMHIDVAHMEDHKFLVSVFKPLNLMTATYLGNKSYSSADLIKAIRTQVSIVRAKELSVHCIHSDSDSRFAAISEVDGIPLKVCISHEPIAERAIRTLKDRVRTILSALPYVLPSSLLKWLVFFCVTMINICTKSDGMGTSAYESFGGKKLNVKVDLKTDFGSYAMVYRPQKTKNDVRSRRCTGGISLGPTLNDRGTQMFFLLKTKKVVRSDNFREVPLSDEVISVIEAMDDDHNDSDYEDTEVLSDGESDQDFETEEPGPIEDVAVPLEEEIMLPDVDVVNDTLEFQELTEPDLSEVSDDAEPDLSAVSDEHVVNAMIALNDHPNSLDKVNLSEHMSLKTALEIGGELAKAGAEKEINSMVIRKVFEPIHMNEIDNKFKSAIIPAGFFMKKKSTGVWKGRLIFLGDQLTKFKCYDVVDTFAPTVSLMNLFIFFAWVAASKACMIHVDFETAFLNCELDSSTPVYMRLNKQITKIMCELHPGKYDKYVDHNGSMAVMLKKALYGLKQSPRLWYLKLRSALEATGYTVNPEDECVFSKVVNGSNVDLCVYVDDMIMAHQDREVLLTEAKLIGSHFSGHNVIADNEDMKYIGLSIARNERMDVIIGMKDYTSRIIKEHGGQKMFSTPGEKLDFQVDNSPLLLNKSEIDLFHSQVAKLLFLAKRTRCDILLQVSHLASKVNAPTIKNRLQLDRVFGYLKGTSNKGIIFDGGGELKLRVYADASFMLHEDLISRDASVGVLNGGVVWARTSKQKMRARSACEAELISASAASDDIMAAIRFLRGQGWCICKVPLYQDNRAVLDIIAAGKPTSQRTKHFAMRHFILSDLVSSEDIELVWLNTKDMIADLLTKPLTGAQFVMLRDVLVKHVCEHSEETNRSKTSLDC